MTDQRSQYTVTVDPDVTGYFKTNMHLSDAKLKAVDSIEKEEHVQSLQPNDFVTVVFTVQIDENEDNAMYAIATVTGKHQVHIKQLLEQAQFDDFYARLRHGAELLSQGEEVIH